MENQGVLSSSKIPRENGISQFKLQNKSHIYA